jgi:hypothetical protein
MKQLRSAEGLPFRSSDEATVIFKTAKNVFGEYSYTHSKGMSYRLPLCSDILQVPLAIIYDLYPHRLGCPPAFVDLITDVRKTKGFNEISYCLR